MSVPSDRKVAAERAEDQTVYEVTEFGRRPVGRAPKALVRAWRLLCRVGRWVGRPIRHLYRLLRPHDPAAA